MLLAKRITLLGILKTVVKRLQHITKTYAVALSGHALLTVPPLTQFAALGGPLE